MTLTVPDDLTDGRIRLRTPTPDDAAAITEACQDPEIARWTRVPTPYTEQDARDFVEYSDRARRAGQELVLLVVDPRTDELFGAVALHRVDDPDGVAQVGYWVTREARGRGVATAAVRLLAAWAFGGLGLSRLEVLTAVGNEASHRVAERSGFRREGVLRSRLSGKEGRWDAVLFSLLPADLQG
jgi:RimJ/RimL family protein N-acetyltransferase